MQAVRLAVTLQFWIDQLSTTKSRLVDGALPQLWRPAKNHIEVKAESPFTSGARSSPCKRGEKLTTSHIADGSFLGQWPRFRTERQAPRKFHTTRRHRLGRLRFPVHEQSPQISGTSNPETFRHRESSTRKLLGLFSFSAMKLREPSPAIDYRLYDYLAEFGLAVVGGSGS